MATPHGFVSFQICGDLMVALKIVFTGSAVSGGVSRLTLFLAYCRLLLRQETYHSTLLPACVVFIAFILIRFLAVP